MLLEENFAINREMMLDGNDQLMMRMIMTLENWEESLGPLRVAPGSSWNFDLYWELRVEVASWFAHEARHGNKAIADECYLLITVELDLDVWGASVWNKCIGIK